MRLKFKWIIYGVLLLAGVAINTHQFFIEQWMRFQVRNEHIVVTMTTIPQRIAHMQPMLQTILDQNVAIKAIYLSVPYTFKRDNLSYTIPQWLKNEKRVTILRSNDYGPATKLLGALENANIPNNAIVITLDDDIKYPKNTVLQLAYKAHKHPNKAICICGSNFDYDANKQIAASSITGITKNLTNNAHVAIAQGFAGVAYRRNFFNNQIFEVKNAPQACINSDDLYLSFYLARRGITRQILQNRYINFYKIGWINDLSLSDSALHKLIPKPIDKHRACLAYLKTLDPDVPF